MKPKQYFRLTKKTYAEAARAIGYTKQHLTSVINGKTPCGRKLADAIETWSDHAITWIEMMKLYKERQSR